MNRYIISYDVKGSNPEKSNKVRLDLIIVLLSLGAKKLSRPTASTITFSHDSGKAIKLTKEIFKFFTDNLYFVISELAHDELKNPNTELTDTFLEDIEKASKKLDIENVDLFDEENYDKLWED